ncbi:MAG: hypothetical protein EBY06_02140 [Burkholderiaceae bacterium]|nr:hypothetical protein [Burkholderiaceae bacterium]
MFALDGKKTNFSDDDRARRNTIALLLEEWGLFKILNKDEVRFVTVRERHPKWSMSYAERKLSRDLFKEGKGVVAQGQLDQKGIFQAKQVLAKHDENYMPPEAAEALEKAKSKDPQAAPTLKEYGGKK